MPFFGGENRVGLLKQIKKGTKKQKNKQKQTKKNKEGLGPSEVALRAPSPDP